MRTPSGVECQYFYGNYFRGRHDEECRLIGHAPSPNNWSPNLCTNCPVPGILLANACTNMILQAVVKKGFMGFKKQVVVSAYCSKTRRDVTEPAIGCGECHPLPPVFTEKLT